jgi:hypothetical protein
MTTHRDIRAAIVAVIASVPDIGQVHGWERYDADGDWMGAHYVSEIAGSPLVRGWYVRRLQMQRQRHAGLRKKVLTTWLIRGFHGVADANQSELGFDDLIDQLIAAFDANQTLGLAGVMTADEELAGLQLQDSTPVLAGGVLCHQARLILRTNHIE